MYVKHKMANDNKQWKRIICKVFIKITRKYPAVGFANIVRDEYRKLLKVSAKILKLWQVSEGVKCKFYSGSDAAAWENLDISYFI